MQFFNSYIITNFILLCLSAVMTLIALQKWKEHPKTSIYMLAIIGTTIIISIFDTMIKAAQYEWKSIFLTTLFSCINYVLRPSCILLFIFFSGYKKNKYMYLLFIPLAVDFLIYILPLIPATSHLVFRFLLGEDGSIYWFSGNTILRYTSHIISAIYLAYLLYQSVFSIQTKHMSYALALIICAVVVIIAVLIETFIDTTGEIHLLNTSIAISVIFYYLYIVTERTKFDPLTNLFNRAMFYSDMPKMKKDITGLIQIDMNGLKYINDNFGHLEGDNGLIAIADTLKRCATRKMYVYRLGGDEFTILATNESEEKIIETIKDIKNELARTKYSAAIGFAYRIRKDDDLNTLIKLADNRMYEDKALYYKNTGYDRRKA